MGYVGKSRVLLKYFQQYKIEIRKLLFKCLVMAELVQAEYSAISCKGF